MRFWISWVQPTEDHRPLHYPPGEAILGWWCSGEDCATNNSMLCAVVEAASEKQAKRVILKEWPEAGNVEWRFVEERGDDWLPGDRFPLSDWMKPRFTKERK